MEDIAKAVGLPRVNSTTYLDQKIGEYQEIERQKGNRVRNYDLVKCLNDVKSSNYISMLRKGGDRDSELISIHQIPHLAKGVPTIDPVELMLIRVLEIWGRRPEEYQPGEEIIKRLVELFSPSPHEVAFVEAAIEASGPYGEVYGVPSIDSPEKKKIMAEAMLKLHNLDHDDHQPDDASDLHEIEAGKREWLRKQG